MKLAVSSIAWTNDEEVAVAERLRQLGVKYVEIAPTKQWDNPTQASADEIQAYKDFWARYDIEIVAFQSMLFNRPDLKIFETAENRQATLGYLRQFIQLGGKFGIQAMVFGSPKNRQRGDLSMEAANDIAMPFFAALGEVASQAGLAFCIEPNPIAYACDFVTTAAEGTEFVRATKNAGFGLHLDIAGMTLAEDDVVQSIKNAQDVLRHFHISSPYLEQVEDRPDVKHREAAAALHSINYQGCVSIEMRPGEAGENVARVEKAARFAQSVYA